MDFNNKLVLITGASSGIGAATAKEFAKHNARVLLLARRKEELRKVAEEIQREGGYAKYLAADITDHKSVERVTNKIKKEIGVPDIIFNNAGSGPFKFIEETTPEEALQLLTPYVGGFFITKAFMQEMLKNNKGHIVNMTSHSYVLAFPGATGYIAANAAMRGFTDALRADLYGTKINITLVACSKVNSTFWENNPGSELRCPSAHDFLPTPSTVDVGKAIVKGVYHERKQILIPRSLLFAVCLKYICPPFMRWLLYKTGYKRGSQGTTCAIH
ncbi:MAG: SDR family oxidoreductase [Nanoarchaeota archaeon]